MAKQLNEDIEMGSDSFQITNRPNVLLPYVVKEEIEPKDMATDFIQTSNEATFLCVVEEEIEGKNMSSQTSNKVPVRVPFPSVEKEEVEENIISSDLFQTANMVRVPFPSLVKEEIEENNISSDLYQIPNQAPFPSVVDRYFTRLYKVNLPRGAVDYEKFETSRNDVRILWHSNKICLVTLAPSHIALSPGRTITEVNFRVTSKCNRAHNKISGKRKRGAQWLNPESPLCIITMDNSEKCTVHAGIRGSLIEVNEFLLKTPRLLTQKPETNGYIAVVMIKLQEKNRMTSDLLSELQYQEYLKQMK